MEDPQDYRQGKWGRLSSRYQTFKGMVRGIGRRNGSKRQAEEEQGEFWIDPLIAGILKQLELRLDAWRWQKAWIGGMDSFLTLYMSAKGAGRHTVRVTICDNIRPEKRRSMTRRRNLL